MYIIMIIIIITIISSYHHHNHTHRHHHNHNNHDHHLQVLIMNITPGMKSPVRIDTVKDMTALPEKKEG